MIRAYYSLTKPGIIRGNLLTASAGFFLAAQGRINLGLLVAMLAGTSLIIAAACVFNNYMDRDIDKLMKRTRKRALVSGSIPPKRALIFGVIIGLAGVIILALLVNMITLYIGLFGLFAYVVLYGYFKRRSVHGTLVGTISGAVPPVAGYTAVTNHIDGAAITLFVILVFWQMPHFYAIAMYRLKDYATAAIPVLPVKKGMRVTKVQTLLYIVGFVIACGALTVLGYTSYGYLIVVLVLGLSWLGFGLKNYHGKNNELWGRKMFLFSLVVITLLCLTIFIDSFVGPGHGALG